MNETMSFDSDKTVVGAMPGSECTQMVGAPRFEATQYAANINCPVCQTPNPPSEAYCQDCGFMLSGAPVDLADIPKPQDMGRVLSSDGALEFSLKAGENSVGRENADVLLSNNTVSRKHAKLILENGSVFVEDAGSTNGTYVDGVKAQPGVRVEVKDASELSFGSVVLKYQAPVVAKEEPAADENAVEPDESAVVAGEADETPSEAESIEPGPEGAHAEETREEEPVKLPVGQLVAKDSSLVVALFDGVNTIGRRDGVNTAVVADPYCSGRHADLTAEDGVFTLTDLGSTNGTLVNGVKLEPNAPRVIQPGDEITLGNPVFRLEVSNG